VEPFAQPTSGQSTIFISLEGLENYLACWARCETKWLSS
jgi:hypothetical protein